MKKIAIIPEGTQALYDKYQYAPAIRVGDMVWASGVTGMKANGEIPATLVEQADVAFSRLKGVLEAAGASMEDIVELVTYHTEFPYPDLSKAFMEVKARYVTRDFPAWTAVGVTGLAIPGLHLEIKAIAVVGSGN